MLNPKDVDGRIKAIRKLIQKSDKLKAKLEKRILALEKMRTKAAPSKPRKKKSK